ncbi:uncharacterized protein LOC127836820 [Dreissena polymorpha]|uniref:VWFA domain-containing protein n=1 Tax=Dreissena polymorpha TaxID=45954 RepID=A0A9D4J0E2_DREPO|nr:uncharacterized protein LOC127836820 [Dreissena polymorpha]KAH3791329.1 hypothetical protein DPMN_144812 [Dreissena polymorpha]
MDANIGSYRMRTTSQVTGLMVILLGSSVYPQPLFEEDVFRANTSGPQVVENVLDLIGSTCLLGNRIFLRRAARVESDDGRSADTYRDSFRGGIWNIGESNFNLTTNNLQLSYQYSVVKSHLNVDWSAVTWSDLRKPIISGLAATLLIKAKNMNNIPEDITAQSQIWSIVNPGVPMFTFYSTEIGHRIECDADAMLDLVIILDFQKLPTLDFVDVINFLKGLLDRFRLSMDGTRVGIVTKRLHPTAAWLLNSQASIGYSVVNVLTALRFQAGPTFTGDALKFARETMFKASAGARAGSSKVALLLTDTVTEPVYAREEAKHLRDEGISLKVVQLTNASSDPDVELLVERPACLNARQVTSFKEMQTLVDRLTSELCRAPAVLLPGNYTYPCHHTLVARLPDSSNGISVKATMAGAGAEVFAATRYPLPDETSHDIRLQAGHVLYIRGSDPMYIRVKGQRSSCTGDLTIEIKETDTFRGLPGVCAIAGTVRPCTDAEMTLATSDVILVRDTVTQNLCDSRNRSVETYPHPVDNHKFLMCDQADNLYVGICPVGITSCVHTSSGCKYSNPCSPELLLSGVRSQMEPCGNQSNYVTCTSLGVAEVTSCPPAQVWNHDTARCVFKYVHAITGIGSNADDQSVVNPCIHAHEDHMYFPYPGASNKYIFCDHYGNAYAQTCRSGVWNEQMKICTDVNANVLG